MLWFHHGYVEYRFPNRVPANATFQSIQLGLELSSEALLHHSEWPSFGGQRGVLTPAWWESWNSHYGLLKSWQVTTEGSFIDGIKLSAVAISALNIMAHDYIAVRIGVKADA